MVLSNRNFVVNKDANRGRKKLKHTTLKLHALEMIRARSVLSGEEVIEILDKGITLNLGREIRSRRVHILFHSPVDEECFVAVQDEKTLEVVTVLPPDFDRHCKLPPDAINELMIMHGRFPKVRGRNKVTVV